MYARMPNIYGFYKLHHPKGLEIISLDMDEEDPVADVKKLTAKLGQPPFLVFRGVDSELSYVFSIDYLPVSAIPVSVFIEKSGVIKLINSGL